jgi:cation:H+ antiporter
MDLYLFLYFGALIASLVFLWWSGGLSVDYSIRTADLFNLNVLFIGFVLISVSTGLPELSIVITSIFKSVPAISAATVLGSNVCISLVLGLAILIYGSLKIDKKEVRDSLLLLIVTALSVVFVFALDKLNKVIGLILILIYFFSIFWLWKTSSKKEALSEEKLQEKIEFEDLKLLVQKGRGKRQKPGRIARSEKIKVLLKLFGSILLVLAASEFVVRFAIIITEKMALSLYAVGATILAVGTSLPELSLSLNGMKKKQYSLVLGNALGSVLEQGTLLMGILALASKTPIWISKLRSLVPFMFFSFFIIGFSIIKRKEIGRIEAVLMLVSFVIFLFVQFFKI